MLDVPVAFVIFNRPESTAKSFEKIREVKPRELFLISDAARPDRIGEEKLVEECRRIAEAVDWPCHVHPIYAQSNMGCGGRISSGITAAFELVDRLIVLEDDCVADESFFSYCEVLLEKYEHDERIMSVSGNNFQLGRKRSEASYYFSKYPHCWGWATWRRAWQHFDLKIAQWPAFRDSEGLRTMCYSQNEVDYWTKVFDRVHSGNSQSWAFPWALSCWMNHGLAILPEVNLVSNIGFNQEATHTSRRTVASEIPAQRMTQIDHPRLIHRHHQADQFTDEIIFSGTVRRDPFKRVENFFRSLRDTLKR